MLTIKKIKEYEEFGGLYDGFLIKKKLDPNKYSISDDEWGLVESFIQDIRLCQKKLASEEFEKRLYIKLKTKCDSEDTIDYLTNISN